MKVRFEIFKSFIRVDLQLQLEVEVDLPRQIRVFLSVFKRDKSHSKKKDGRVPRQERHQAVSFFFNWLSSCLKNA